MEVNSRWSVNLLDRGVAGNVGPTTGGDEGRDLVGAIDGNDGQTTPERIDGA
jgi:hypothetical protein